jgi:DNA-3-methyladenine glycosylase
VSGGHSHDRTLPARFYARPAEQVARDLLGAILVSLVDGVETAGRIVETEAYVGPHDEASHAAARIGRTPRNAAMFGAPGTAYVYRSYGVHWCLNAVTDRVGFPAAVLIRAIEPLRGLDVMRTRRIMQRGTAVIAERELCSGPGKLAAALDITGALDGHSLRHPPLTIRAGIEVTASEVVVAPRVGITRAIDWPLRFMLKGSPWISRR